MLVIPLFGDQLANGARVERQGCGKVLKIEGNKFILNVIRKMLMKRHYFDKTMFAIKIIATQLT